jgi:hypothetical protein
LYRCGHQSLTIIIHYVLILVGAVGLNVESVLTGPVPVVARLFRKAHNPADNSFDSHVNSLPDCLLVGSQQTRMQLYRCGHQSLTIIIHYALILVSAVELM